MRYEGNWRDHPKAGSSCIRVEWTGGPGEVDGYLWNGIMFQDAPTWEEGPGPGFDLRGATRLRGWVRTDNPGLRLKLLVGFDADSCGEVTIDGIWSKPITRDWQPFEINLRRKDLSHVSGGFAFVFNDVYTPNPEKGCVFYLDEVEFDLPRPEGLRLLRSYEPHPRRDEDDSVFRNACFLYDNALAILAFLARGTKEDLRRARLLADALIYCQQHDRAFKDGRLRNAYMSGDIPLHPGEPVRLPGWWNAKAEKWYEDRFQVSTHTGNLAWAIISLLGVYERTQGERYLQAAVCLGEWIQTNCFDTQGPGGYTGGWEGWERTEEHRQGQEKATFKSTEMNLDLIVAFARLYEATGDTRWLDRAHHARRFVEALWDEQEGRFLTGTKEDGRTPNRECRPLDVNTWALLVLGPNEKTRAAIRWAETHCLVEGPAGDGFTGFDFNDDRDGIWWEGTGQMVVAYQILGETEKANRYLREMRRALVASATGQGLGLVAATHDEVTTGFDVKIVENGRGRWIPWLYYRQVHLGATAWFLFAELGYNPYWARPTAEPVPSLDSLKPLGPTRPASGATAEVTVPPSPAPAMPVQWTDLELTSPYD